jgi:hypothetical protein
MSNSDSINVTVDEEALQSAESSLDAQITVCVRLAETALNHIQQWPTVSSLAGVDRTIDLLQFFLAQAERLKDGGRPAVHDRLTKILKDVTDARVTWAQTLGVLVAADRSDAKKITEHQSAVNKQLKEVIDERFKQGQTQAAENRKLL